QRGRARLRPRRDFARRQGRRRGGDARARAPARDRDRDRGRSAALPGGEAGRRAAPRRRVGRGRQEGLRREGPQLDARRDLPRGRAGRNVVITIIGYAMGEAVRRKVFLVVVVLTAIFLGL